MTFFPFFSLIVFFSMLWRLRGHESLFEFQCSDLQGNMIPLSTYSQSSVILIVNVASNCGYTFTNYRDLNYLYKKYHEYGLEILAFSSNSFDQEPGSNADVHKFVSSYGVSFPVFGKINVIGPDSHPLYSFLKENTDKMEIPWNFAKFLIVDGVPVKRYHPRVSPKKMEPDILEYLGLEEYEEEL